MTGSPTTFGIPDTLPPLTYHALRGNVVFAIMGMLVFLLGHFPALRPSPSLALPIAICWLALPLWGLFRYLRAMHHFDETVKGNTQGTRFQVIAFAIVMLTTGVVLYAWGRTLGLSSQVTFGFLLILEGLAGVIVSLTEWWRISHAGLSLGLMLSGFLLPLTTKVSVAVPVGASVVAGSLLSIVALSLQLHWYGRKPSPDRCGGQ